MKNNLLEDLYYGNISPYDNFELTSDYKKWMEVLSEHERKLTAFLKTLPNAEEQQDWLAEIIKANSEISLITESQRFTYGFRLGAKFMLETFMLS